MEKKFFCYPGWMCGPSLRKIGQGFLSLLIRNEKVTDEQTDRKALKAQQLLPGQQVNGEGT